MTSEDEIDLISKLKSGDERAFNKIYEIFHARVYNFSLKLLPNAEEAAEILQRVFVALWEQRNQIDPAKPIGAYLFSIAKYMVYAEFKQLVYRKAALEDLAGKSTVLRELTKDEVLYNELVHVLKTIIDRLPEKRKEIFTLSRFEGLSYKEIADRLDISENTVDTQIRRALDFVRTEYSNYFS